MNNTSTSDRNLIPPSALSIRDHNESSRSALSTPRGAVRQQSLAEHYNSPLQPLQTWISKKKLWTRSQLQRERFEFFESRVTGRREIWEALKQVIELLREGEVENAQAILDASGVTLPTGRLVDGAYDEIGNLYKIPEAVISDPSEVIEDVPDVDSQTVSGTGDGDIIDAKLEAAEQNGGDATTEAKNSVIDEKSRAAKGKTPLRDAIKVRCRLSDRGSPDCDLTVFVDRKEPVSVLTERIRAEKEVSRHDENAYRSTKSY
jgi:hypothetical protein